MPADALLTVSTRAPLAARRVHFPNEITFHTPGLKRHSTSEINGTLNEFVTISITGSACALNCDHCQTKVLTSMVSLPHFGGDLFDLCAELKESGAKGVLISGGSDASGKVPLLGHIDDLKRVRSELGLLLRLHCGLTDEATLAALAEIDVDGVMVDIIGDEETIKEVYHLDSTPDDYGHMLSLMRKYNLPAIPHIILGHYYGKMRGEYSVLEMIKKYPPKVLVLVILMPLTGTPMEGVAPPPLDEIERFFITARESLPAVPIQLGCAKPLGPIKRDIDKLAVDAGFNGIAFPAEGVVGYATEQGLKANFISACCGVTWS